jgi:hypothetical protein
MYPCADRIRVTAICRRSLIWDHRHQRAAARRDAHDRPAHDGEGGQQTPDVHLVGLQLGLLLGEALLHRLEALLRQRRLGLR